MKILLVTQKALWQVPWADSVATATEALALWREKRHDYVFADFGDLGQGVTGARFATGLRRTAPEQSVVIILMVDAVQTAHIVWAQRCGANGVIKRGLPEIVSQLRAAGAGHLVDAAASHDAGTEAAASRSMVSVAALVESRLQAYAHMGPARSVVVADAIEQFIRERPGARPTAGELAAMVAVEVPSPGDRAAFLNSFAGDA